jgi:hypothetical protein
MVFGVTLFLDACAGVDKFLASQQLTLVSKQSSYKEERERVTKYASLSKDRYDTFKNVSVSNREGIGIDVPINDRGDGVYATQKNGSRSLPFSFDCDYTKGETKGDLSISYQDPYNLYGRIYSLVSASCIPLSDEEKNQQIAVEKESERAAAEKKDALKRQEERKMEQEKEASRIADEKERQRRDNEARELSARSTPQYKRGAAVEEIKKIKSQVYRANKAMEEENRIGVISGYVNATRLHDIGAYIVKSQQELDRQWEIYKYNGGELSSIEEIK